MARPIRPRHRRTPRTHGVCAPGGDSLYASHSSKASPHPKDPAEGQTLDAGHTHPDGDPNGYVMDHTSVVYLFGPDGTTLICTGGAAPPDYAADLTNLLGS